MRAKSQWTPRTIALWVIAAIVASLLVCSQKTPPAPERPAGRDGTNLEVEIVD